ncbi:MAG: glycoside hydrolase family 15 protein [Pseudomonadota bacterium]
MRGTPGTDFDDWVDAQVRRSSQGLLASISPLAIVKHRPGFGQTIRPVAGAIVASTVLADWDPDPDYFFHWFRDSALVIDALRSLYSDRLVGIDGPQGRAVPSPPPEGGEKTWGGPAFSQAALQHLRDFIRFSLGLTRLDGRIDAAVPDRRARVSPDFLQFARDDADLGRAHGDAVASETRVNPDGTLDISRWARPQHDGPPLRALTMLRWVAEGSLADPLLAEAAELIRFDLGFTLRHARKPSYDIWEEEVGHHYYTLRVSAAALAEGAAWFVKQGDLPEAQRCQDESQTILGLLDGHWFEGAPEPAAARQAPRGGEKTLGRTGGCLMGDDDAPGYYRSRRRPDGQFGGAKSLDIAVILSAIHTFGPPAAVHGVADPRMQSTLKRLEALFGAAYPINQGRAPGHGPAMGRYEGDVYHSGGAWYLSTLGAAEFCFRAAMVAPPILASPGPLRGSSQSWGGPAIDLRGTTTAGTTTVDASGRDAPDWFARGDAYLATVRVYTPASGDLSEQFDQRTGEQTSAKHLAWSYAAFISCAGARRAAAAAVRATPRR